MLHLSLICQKSAKQNAQKVGAHDVFCLKVGCCVVLAPALSDSSQLGYFGWIMGLTVNTRRRRWTETYVCRSTAVETSN